MSGPTTNTTTQGTSEYFLVKAIEGQLAFGSPHLFKAAAHDGAGASTPWFWRLHP